MREPLEELGRLLPAPVGLGDLDERLEHLDVARLLGEHERQLARTPRRGGRRRGRARRAAGARRAPRRRRRSATSARRRDSAASMSTPSARVVDAGDGARQRLHVDARGDRRLELAQSPRPSARRPVVAERLGEAPQLAQDRQARLALTRVEVQLERRVQRAGRRDRRAASRPRRRAPRRRDGAPAPRPARRRRREVVELAAQRRRLAQPRDGAATRRKPRG